MYSRKSTALNSSKLKKVRYRCAVKIKLFEKEKEMKTLTIVTVVVLALCSMASAGQLLSVNGEQTEAIILKAGQACSVEVSSDDASTYNAYVGFDFGNVLGSFLHSSTKKAAGSLAGETPYSSSEDNFEGYFITAAGSGLAAGVHFIFSYTPDQVGQTELKLYDAALSSVIDSISITVVEAEMGTAFTYQGRLIDAENAADGEYDFEFDIYDAPSGGVLLASTVDVNALDVIDGYFTVELDFGSSAFAGDGVWLDIGVRSGESTGAYTTLSPRQRITPTPYATYAAASNWDNLANIPADIADGDSTLTEPQVESYIANDVFTGYLPYNNGTKLTTSGLYYNGSNIGLGTTTTSGAKLGIINNSESYALYAQTTKTTGNNYGIYSIANGDTTGQSYGVRAVSSSLSANNYGVYGSATTSSSGNNFGVFGQAVNNGAGNAHAGYFDGDVQVTGYLNRVSDLIIAYDDGAEVAIGISIDHSSKLRVYSDTDRYGIHSYITGNYNGRTGVFGYASGNSPYSSYGVQGSSLSATSHNYGVYGKATTSSSGNNYAVYGQGNNNGTGYGYAGYFAGDVRVTTDLNQSYDLRIAADDGAEVAIGTSVNTIRKLNVYSDSDTYSIYAQNSRTSGVRYALYGVASGNSPYSGYGVRGSSTSATANNYGVYGSAATSSSGHNYGVYGVGSNSGTGSGYAGYFVGNVYVGGNIAYTGSISDISDVRLKENIVPLENAIEKISSLKAIYFNNKGESPDNREIGVIAQDVEKVLPELVSTNKEGYKMVDYTKLAPVLIEAVKELMAENEQLKQRLDAMEEKLSDI